MKIKQYTQRVSITALLMLGLVACNFIDDKPGNAPNVDSNFTINLHDVPDYDANASTSDQYLSVINYLRSLNVSCNDTLHLSGPVDVNLSWNSDLESAAREHSDDMANNDFYSHIGSDESESKERIKNNGYHGMVTAENIAHMWKKNEKPPADAWVEKMENWMKSEKGSCSIIMNKAFTDFGMHESRRQKGSDNNFTVYWTQTFGG